VPGAPQRFFQAFQSFLNGGHTLFKVNVANRATSPGGSSPGALIRAAKNAAPARGGDLVTAYFADNHLNLLKFKFMFSGRPWTKVNLAGPIITIF
jgi:hypothetical protein